MDQRQSPGKNPMSSRPVHTADKSPEKSYRRRQRTDTKNASNYALKSTVQAVSQSKWIQWHNLHTGKSDKNSNSKNRIFFQVISTNVLCHSIIEVKKFY